MLQSLTVSLPQLRAGQNQWRVDQEGWVDPVEYSCCQKDSCLEGDIPVTDATKLESVENH